MLKVGALKDGALGMEGSLGAGAGSGAESEVESEADPDLLKKDCTFPKVSLTSSNASCDRIDQCNGVNTCQMCVVTQPTNPP